jgi:uncharacterized protein (TIGR02646 family)
VRHIHKGREPASLTTWKAALPGAAPNWDDFGRRFPVVKRDLKDALRQEQFQVCCYCERIVTTTDSHIEHLVPRSANASRAYDYSNLLASCEGEGGRGRPPETCGHLKGNHSLPVHPLMPDCVDYFVFRSSGSVEPTREASKQVLAQQSITILGLDSARVGTLRRVALKDMDSTLPELGSGSPAEIANFRAAVQQAIAQSSRPDSLGRLTPFSTSLIQHLQRYL